MKDLTEEKYYIEIGPNKDFHKWDILEESDFQFICSEKNSGTSIMNLIKELKLVYKDKPLHLLIQRDNRYNDYLIAFRVDETSGEEE